ncbi:hypothetical protein AYP77_02690 [Lactobacillus crispatus]|uniref:hypothetical protein n=1 Tax=Lactobacillus crispatus TaxID=47770 RepID=UPI000B5D957C|nr:hypothetical protein [Lactobacillus crispatus]OXC12267.1 hypothetical protein AYP77_02690 [Lactobacillus crispatus]
MSKYSRTKLLPKGLQIIQGVIRGKTFEITSASYSESKTNENDVMNQGSIVNPIGHIPIFAKDDKSLADQGILGIELSFTQESTRLNRDINLQSIQIEGRQNGTNVSYPIAFSLAKEPERLTLSDPSFEFRIMVYVQVGDTDNVTININPDGLESRREHQQDIDEIINALSVGYVPIALKDSKGNQLLGHDGKQLFANKPIVDFDPTLSVRGKAPDSKQVGDNFRALEDEVLDIEHDLRETFETKKKVKDVNNLALANADANKDQDNEIAVLQNRASELEANRQTIHLLGHDWSGLSDHTSDSFKATRQFIVNDVTLTNANAYANAKATGDAIEQNYQQLSQAIGNIYAWLDNLGNQQEIVDLTNVVSALRDQNDEADRTIQRLRNSVEITSAESQKDNLDALHEPGRYYLGNAKGYSDAVLEVARLGYTNKVMQYIYSAGNIPNRTERRIGTRNNGNSYSWSEWESEY